MLQQNILSIPQAGYDKAVTIYTDDSVAPGAAVLYFHGGGLLFGQREDLPRGHLEAMTAAGYAVLAFDYPLAPAADLDLILQDVCASINDYITHWERYLHAPLPYVLWGRSAGAYLCLLAASGGRLKALPKGVLSYYGYGLLCDGWFQEKSPYYSCLPAVDGDCMNRIPRQLHADGAVDSHYSVYVYARQTGAWRQLVYRGREKDFYLKFSLRNREDFPCPLFCAHSLGDPDVPYQEFLQLCNRYRPRRLVVAGQVHDFDRDSASRSTARLLEATLSFMQEVLA